MGNNKKKTTTKQKTMKVFAAALLAFSAQAIRLMEDGCGPKPHIPEGATIDDFFYEIAGEDEMIDEHEARHALGCAVEWKLMSEKEAKKLFKEGEKMAGEDGKLSYHELTQGMAQVDSGEDSCGPKPDVPEGFTEKDLFHEIAGTDGEIDEGEARHALGCAVKWGFLDEKEAKKIFKEGEKRAGADGKMTLEESGATDDALAQVESGPEDCGPVP